MAETATLGDVLVAIARLEAKQDQMLNSIERLRDESDTHLKKIAYLERKIAVIEARQGPRVHWVTWIVGIVAIVGLGLSVFDRIYI